ncbi:hypothetical protein [Streptomyces sp. DT117]|uniref:hypothetical protein n=1 Tax=Streptomyces sp. DT117 TaxID=3393422 RepID=UPI003CF64E3D
MWSPQAAYGIRNPQAPDADMPRGSVDPRTGGTLFAHLADVRWAWARCDLSTEERRSLFLRYGLDWPDPAIAAEDGVTDRAVRYRIERGVGKLAAWLNGAEYIDGYDEELEQSA